MKLKLDCDFQNWQNEKAMHLNEKYFQALNSISNIDECQCCYCGAKDGEFLELHHKDGDHDNYDLDNLDLICCFCHRTIHLGWACIDNCASLYYLPNETGYFKLDDIDFSFYNILSRLELFSRFFQKKGQAHNLIDNPAFLELWDNLGWVKGRNFKEAINFHFGLHDILTHFQSNEKEAKEFLENQVKGKKGLFFLRFNSMVFKPLSEECGYTYSQRVNELRRDERLDPNKFNEIVQRTIADLKNLQGQEFEVPKPKFDKDNQKLKDKEIEIAETSEVDEQAGEGEAEQNTPAPDQTSETR